MTTHIDVGNFIRTSGNHALLAIVCQAFMEQLPEWRRDFSAASASGEQHEIAQLLHKMKGCCYAVAANQAALALEAMERRLPTSTADLWAIEADQLLTLLDQVARELLTHAAHRDARSAVSTCGQPLEDAKH